MKQAMLVGLVACLSCAVDAAAQSDQQMPLTWVRYFTVEPGHADDFEAMIMEDDAPIFDGMIESGDAITWGMLRPFTRTEEEWTHAIWITAPSWASYDELIAGFIESESARSERENDRKEQKFLGMVDPASITDRIFRHQKLVDPDLGEGDVQPRYFRFGFHKILPGHASDVADMYESFAVPVYTNLDEEGAITAAGLASQEIVTDGEWTHLSWVALPDLASMDKVAAAFKEADESRSPGDREKMRQMMTEMVEMEAHRSSIAVVTHFAKAEN